MVGGGPGAFIGAVHRKAAALDGEMDLVAGAFSSSEDKSQQQGAELMLDPGRVYASFEEMAEREAARSGRDFARADAIRDTLQERGIEILDTPEGPRWRRR